MILEEATKEAFGYALKALRGHTNRLIISACETCGTFRICQKTNYKTFCSKCRRTLEVPSEKAVQKSKRKKQISNKNKRVKKERELKRVKKQKEQERKTQELEEYKKQMREDRRVLWAFSKNYHGEYCNLFNDEYKRKIRERYGNGCFLCGTCEKDNGQALSVHHVNYDPSCGCDGAKCICVPLCISCHSKTNHNRGYWKKKIVRLLAESDYFDT